jgi:hypothetical protein
LNNNPGMDMEEIFFNIYSKKVVLLWEMHEK